MACPKFIVSNQKEEPIRIQNVNLYFACRDLFQQPSSKQCSEITLRSHLEEEAVCQLINFCYSSDITVDSKSADKILTAANFLQVKEVEKLCITFLVAQQALKPEVRMVSKLMAIKPGPEVIKHFSCSLWHEISTAH